MKVAKITAELAQQLIGEPASSTRMFNPVQDSEGNWFISCIEALALSPEEYEQVDFNPEIQAP